MTPDALADLHAACFTRPRPWTAQEFAALLGQRGVVLLTTDGGFLVGRIVAPEAELLTIAVAPAHRRKGAARDLVRRFLATAAQGRAAQAFLEVASDNLAAQALYRSTGWTEVGRRKNYYAAGVDALVMQTCPPER